MTEALIEKIEELREPNPPADSHPRYLSKVYGFNEALDRCIAIIRQHTASEVKPPDGDGDTWDNSTEIIKLMRDAIADVGYEIYDMAGVKAEAAYKAVRPYLRTSEPVSVSLEEARKIFCDYGYAGQPGTSDLDINMGLRAVLTAAGVKWDETP